jgi:S-adenosylmethionine:tRNA ribosyltransferase-isomerase
MDITDFDYNLPACAIAQEPLPKRDEAKLLILERRSGTFRSGVFRDLPNLLSANDLLVLNDTRVIPARLRLKKNSGGKIEIFILREIGQGRAEALVRGRIKEGQKILLAEGIEIEIEQKTAEGKYHIIFRGEIGRAHV